MHEFLLSVVWMVIGFVIGIIIGYFNIFFKFRGFNKSFKEIEKEQQAFTKRYEEHRKDIEKRSKKIRDQVDRALK